MTTKQNAIDLARTARSEAAAIASGTKRTITQIVINWNECVKQAGFMCIYDFPTTGYNRKSQIAEDLIRCADQLDDYCEPNPHAAQTVDQQIRELNAALTRVLDADEAHAEALEMDMGIELALRIIAAMGGSESAGDAAGGCLYRDGFNEINYLVSVALILYAQREETHAEALQMNTSYA